MRITKVRTLRPKTDRDEELFDEHVGAFIRVFSLLEGQLLPVVIHYAKLDLKIGKAILSPLRVENAINHLHRIIEVRRLRGTKIDELEAILQQLAQINQARNDLVHLGIWSNNAIRDAYGRAAVQQLRYYATNRLRAHSRRVVRTRPVSTKILEQMELDLMEILLRLFSKDHVKHVRKMPAWYVAFRGAFPASALPTWRYKPPSPRRRRRLRLVKPPKREAQPPPSGA